MLEKTCLASLIFLSLLSCNGRRVLKPLPDENVIIGKVVSVKIFYFKAVEKFGKPEKGEFKYQRIYTYGENGYLTEEDLLFPNDILVGRFVYKYDGQNHIKESDNYNGDGSLGNTNMYEYDLENSRIKHESFAASDNSPMDKNISKIDRNNNIIEINSYDSRDSLKVKNIYQYDKFGNQIERVIYHSNGELFARYTMAYSDFDNRGNWLKQISFKDGKPDQVISREINYVE